MASATWAGVAQTAVTGVLTLISTYQAYKLRQVHSAIESNGAPAPTVTAPAGTGTSDATPKMIP